MGIAIAALLVAWIGTGTWQIGVVVALAMFAANLVGGGPLLASQAGASAVLVATLQAPEAASTSRARWTRSPAPGSRWRWARSSLPVDARRMARSKAGPVIDSLAAALDHIAAAIERRDAAEADRAVEEVARLRPYHDDLEDSLAEAFDSARMSLGRREALDELAELSELARHLRLAIGDARSLARGVGRAIALEDATPAEIGAAIDGLATATRGLHAVLEGEDQAPCARRRFAPPRRPTRCWRRRGT